MEMTDDSGKVASVVQQTAIQPSGLGLKEPKEKRRRREIGTVYVPHDCRVLQLMKCFKLSGEDLLGISRRTLSRSWTRNRCG